jgi:2,3-bisphosphoglycerate-independent phosphoglycerate mutase
MLNRPPMNVQPTAQQSPAAASAAMPDEVPARPSGITPVLLLILDGFGHRETGDDNAILHARKPVWDALWRGSAHTTIDASERHVGLPGGQMGNSEVGHLNIGAGRVVYQELTKIDHAIETGSFATNAVLLDAIRAARAAGGALHVLGLASPGGVHCHESHLAAIVQLAFDNGLDRVMLHAFLDGRDTPPKSAQPSLVLLEKALAKAGSPAKARIASIVGRYFAMDRDKRWDRVQVAYDLLTQGRADHVASNPVEGLAAAYGRGESDEFVQATAIVPPGTQPAPIADGDAVVFMNFRADRARELTRAFTDPAFDGFPRAVLPGLSAFVTLTRYGDEFDALPAAFPPDSIRNGFGEYLASRGLTQLRIAETEKYAHVTYFFNGGVEEPYPGESRVLVPSPKVATYDLKPEMSAFEVTAELESAIASRRYDAIICNYANCDMVGHTGNFEAARLAVEAIDTCVGRVVAAMKAAGGEVLITADHGNAEMMRDPETNQAHTAHTLNVVPLVHVGRPAKIADGGALQDIAPTLLRMMGVPQPPEMTGRPLVSFD